METRSGTTTLLVGNAFWDNNAFWEVKGEGFGATVFGQPFSMNHTAARSYKFTSAFTIAHKGLIAQLVVSVRLITVRSAVRARMGPLFPHFTRTWPGKSFLGSARLLLGWLSNAIDPGRTRTCNPRLRGPMPYPLGHGAIDSAAPREFLGAGVP